MISGALIVLLLLASLYVAMMNWACAYFSVRNRRLGIDKHHSMVHFVPQILVGLAWLIHESNNSAWLPSIGFIAIALVDISLLFLFFLPVFLAWRVLQNRQSKE